MHRPSNTVMANRCCNHRCGRNHRCGGFNTGGCWGRVSIKSVYAAVKETFCSVRAAIAAVCCMGAARERPQNNWMCWFHPDCLEFALDRQLGQRRVVLRREVRQTVKGHVCPFGLPSIPARLFHALPCICSHLSYQGCSQHGVQSATRRRKVRAATLPARPL